MNDHLAYLLQLSSMLLVSHHWTTNPFQTMKLRRYAFLNEYDNPSFRATIMTYFSLHIKAAGAQNSTMAFTFLI